MTTTRSAGRRVDPALSVRTDRTLIRAGGRSERYLLVDIVAPTVAPDPARRRPPVNLGFVLDRSGSMGGQGKLGLARQAVLEAVHRLDPEDRFSVVTYDDRIDVVVDGTAATPAARTRAADLLARVDARGSTNLHGGWLTGCEQVAAGLLAEGVNRVLLLTDGLANVGVTDHDELGRLALQLRERSISTSTFGVGTDFDERLLQAIADAGGGHFYFIGDAAQLRDHITSEVGETLEVVARDVVVDVLLPDSVRVDVLSPFRTTQRPGLARVHVGDLVSGQVLALVVRLTFDYGEVGREIGIEVRLADRDGSFASGDGARDPVRVTWRYDDHRANDAQRGDVGVDRVVARVFAERATQEAVRLNRDGRYREAVGGLEAVRARIASYAGSDVELRRIMDELRAEEPAYMAPMAELDRKRAHFRSSASLRSRSVDGKSQRQA